MEKKTFNKSASGKLATAIALSLILAACESNEQKVQRLTDDVAKIERGIKFCHEYGEEEAERDMLYLYGVKAAELEEAKKLK